MTRSFVQEEIGRVNIAMNKCGVHKKFFIFTKCIILCVHIIENNWFQTELVIYFSDCYMNYVFPVSPSALTILNYSKKKYVSMTLSVIFSEKASPTTMKSQVHRTSTISLIQSAINVSSWTLKSLKIFLIIIGSPKRKILSSTLTASRIRFCIFI